MKILKQNLKIPACSKDTIARADDVFSHIDSDFENWETDVESPKTDATEVGVLEVTKNATFAQMFTNPDEMCMTQAQILSFVKNHRDMLRMNGHGNFFLFKVGNEFFVAYVSFGGDGQLRVYVFRLSYDYVWRAKYRLRLVLPQLALKHFETKTLSDSDDLSLEARVTELERKMKDIHIDFN